MELKLKTARHDYYEPLSPAAMNCETMREHIVPDSCADIARLVEATAQVFVTSREVSGDGRLCAGGTVEVSVLYIPEKGIGPCVLRVQLPFQCCSDGQWGADAEYLDIRGEVQSVDARVLNPRKVLSRVNIVLYPSMCRRVSRSICTDAVDSENIELLRCCRQTRVIAAVREKEFSFLEEIPLSQDRGGAEEILFCRTEVRGTDCKLIGTKLVVKGIVSATVLYREIGGALELNRSEFPFSQIVDGGGLQEDWDCECAFRTLNAECRIGGESGTDDRHLLTLTLMLRVRMLLHCNEEMNFIADLYSTAANVTCNTEELQLWEDSQRFTKRLNVRESLETGTAVKSVVDMETGCGNVRIDNGTRMMEIPMWARCIYLDENDSLHSVRKEFVVKSPLEQDVDLKCESSALCRGDVMAGILPDGIELRFPVECVIDAGRFNPYICVSGGEIHEEDEQVNSPSLVLRKIGPEERLWSVAKAYRTTCKAILEINELADEKQIPHDKLLLIPRRR